MLAQLRKFKFCNSFLFVFLSYFRLELLERGLPLNSRLIRATFSNVTLLYGRYLVFFNPLVKMSARMADIPCITQVTLKIIHNALLIHKGWLVFPHFDFILDFPTRVHGADVYKVSAIGNHLKEQHDIAPDDIAQFFKILKKCQSKFDCLIFEMFFIKELKPTLNKQCDSIRANLFV